MTIRILRGLFFVGTATALLVSATTPALGLEVTKPVPVERREAVSLAEAVVKALQNNLDIHIGRQTRESRLADIVIEQAKFDPTVSLNGQYNRQVAPLNRPLLGFTGANLQDITKFDQNTSSVTADITQNLPTGANYDINYSPQRSYVSGQNTFLFNPAWTGGLALTVTQPLLKNFGSEINRTFISIAQNNATVEQHVFLDRVLTVIATVEQTFWEMVFANENLKVAQAALKAAEELLASNRAKAKAGVMSIVDVLQAEAAVASRVEQILVAEKSIRDQEDQLRRLLNPAEEELRQDLRLMPTDPPTTSLEAISLQEAIDIAIERRPEILQAGKNVETSDLNTKFAKNQTLPTLSFQGTMGLSGLGADYNDATRRNFGGDFYNYGAGLVLSYPLGNRSAYSTYNPTPACHRRPTRTPASPRSRCRSATRPTGPSRSAPLRSRRRLCSARPSAPPRAWPPCAVCCRHGRRDRQASTSDMSAPGPPRPCRSPSRRTCSSVPPQRPGTRTCPSLPLQYSVDACRECVMPPYVIVSTLPLRPRLAGSGARRLRIDRAWPRPVGGGSGRRRRGSAARSARGAVHPEPELVDQTLLGEGVRQLPAAGDDQVAGVLLLECGDGLDDVALDEGGVPFQRPVDRPRGDVLRHAVDPLGVVAHRRVLAEVRPDGRQPFVRPAAEEQRVGQDQLLEAGVAAVGVELQPLLGCWRLEGAVDGDLVVDDDLSHAGDVRSRAAASASVE